MEENWKKERIEKMEEKLKLAIRESNEKYLKGDVTATWCTFDDAETSDGTFKIRTWPGDSTVDITYVCRALRFADTGDMIASFNTEYYSVKQMALLAIHAVEMYDFDKII